MESGAGSHARADQTRSRSGILPLHEEAFRLFSKTPRLLWPVRRGHPCFRVDSSADRNGGFEEHSNGAVLNVIKINGTRSGMAASGLVPLEPQVG